MRVRYTLSSDEVQAILTEGLQRRGLVRRPADATVTVHSPSGELRSFWLTVEVNAAFPRAEEAPEDRPEGKAKPRGPRTDLERLKDSEDLG